MFFFNVKSDCLENSCVLMTEGYLFDYLLVLLEVLGMLVGTDVVVVDWQFWKVLKKYSFMRQFCVFCNILE